MKILHICPFFSPKFGGSVAVSYQLSKELAKKGHAVTIITSDFNFDKDFAKDVEDYGVEIIPFRTVKNFGLFIYTPSIKKWLRNNAKTFDVFHMHEYRSYQNSIACHYAIKNRIPYIIQPHGSVLPFFEKRMLKKIYDIYWGKQILENASKHIASTKK